MDYGHDGKRKEHSLRAYTGHKLVNPLETPGEVDLTADVDFGELARAVEGKCLAYGPVEQRFFLEYTSFGPIYYCLLGIFSRNLALAIGRTI
jgi:SAM-dependent MidA family methyltransferase